MPLGLGYAFIGGAVPQYFAGLLIERQDLPLMRRAIVDRVGIAIESGAKALFRIARYGGGDEDAIAPHDRRGVSESWNLGLPRDVDAFGGVPLHGRARYG